MLPTIKQGRPSHVQNQNRRATSKSASQRLMTAPPRRSEEFGVATLPALPLHDGVSPHPPFPSYRDTPSARLHRTVDAKMGDASGRLMQSVSGSHNNSPRPFSARQAAVHFDNELRPSTRRGLYESTLDGKALNMVNPAVQGASGGVLQGGLGGRAGITVVGAPFGRDLSASPSGERTPKNAFHSSNQRREEGRKRSKKGGRRRR
uniref:Uncharacterized protein n=1 Tax=Palpitomonas bilix TaxID=652834 RepID=A0A7S3DB57_9EUKA